MPLRPFSAIGLRLRALRNGPLITKIREINARYSVQSRPRKKYVSFALSALLLYLLLLLGILGFRFLTLL